MHGLYSDFFIRINVQKQIWDYKSIIRVPDSKASIEFYSY